VHIFLRKRTAEKERADMGGKHDFDLAVIGGGPGGYVAAIRAAQLGARVALAEKLHLGGVCTNIGCIPTKVLTHAARLMLQQGRLGEFGLGVGEVSLDCGKLGARRDEVVKKLRAGVETLLKSNKVELVRGTASFEDEHTLSVKGDKESVKLGAEKIIIASGSAPVELPVAKFDGKRVIESAAAVRMNELPQSILIVGAGYIGCEFAGIFSAFGVDVTLVELKERILPEMDVDCGREVLKSLKKQGVKVMTSTSLEKLSKPKGALKAVLSSGEELSFPKVLVCVGRRPVSEGMDLERIGVKTGKHGAIVVNEHMQTSLPHVYAVGDVTGGMMLAHVASREGVVAAAHATGTITARMSHRVVPACAFTVPEVATVGMTEERARQEVGEVIVKKFPMHTLGKAHVDGETEGFVKLIARAGTGEVLGVHIAAAEASSMIAEAALAMELEATAEELAETIHAHPTMPEGLHEAAEGVLGLAVNWAG